MGGRMKVKIQKLREDAKIPEKARAGDAGFDLVATSKDFDDRGNAVYGTGLAMEIPEGYAGFIFPRSSISKYNISLANSIGLIDSGYRGELFLKFKPTPRFVNAISNDGPVTAVRVSDSPADYEIGDKIGQLVILPLPSVELELAEELGASERGIGGFGSSGI